MPPGRIIVALPEPSIRLTGPKIIVTLEGANVNWEKYFFCWRRKLRIIFIPLLIKPIYRLIMRRSKVTVRKPNDLS